MRAAYIVIPLITLLVSSIGSYITSNGMGWYRTIRLPDWTPPGSVIGGVWTTIFILTTISVLLVWTKFPRTSRFQWIIGLFILNAILNVGWSALFFGLHMMTAAAWEAGILAANVLVLIFLIWAGSRLAAGLLIPYFLWVCFATFLTATIAGMN